MGKLYAYFISRYAFFVLCTFLTVTAKSQVPIAYYDFEDNSNRNTIAETSIQEAAASIGSPAISVSSLTAAHGTGNGTSATYGGSNTGYSIGYYGFTTSATSTATNPSIKFGPFNCTGFSTLTLTMDVLGIGSKMPANVDVYYSLNDVTYTRIVATTAVTTSFNTVTFTIPAAANGAATLYFKVIGFGAGASPTATDGVMQIDNFTLKSSVITASTSLISAIAHGIGLSSGGSYMPAYTSLNVNGASITVSASSNIILGTVAATTALTLTNGIFDVGNNTLTFQTTNAPFARNGTTQTGTLSISSAGNLVFGTTGNLGGAAYIIPNNVFTSSPIVVNNFTVNRTNALTLGNQSLTIDGGTLTLTAGAFSLGANTLTLQNSNTPLARTSGTLTVATTSNISFGSTGNTGGTAFTIPSGFFTASPPSLKNFTVNRTNSLTLGSQGLTINGTLTLESGILDVGLNALVFQTGATPIAVTSGSLTVSTATNITFGANATAFTIPNNTFTTAPTITNLTINRAGGVTIGNQNFTLNGTLTLTAGVFNVLNSTLTFQNGTPIARNGTTQTGTLSINSAGNLVFGTTGNLGGAAFTVPNNVFTTSPVIVNNFTVNRTNALTLGNQSLTIDGGTLILTAGVFSLGANTLTLQNSNTPLARTSGTLTVATTSNISFGSTGNTGGAAFTIPTGFFTASPPSLKNFTVNRTNSLTLGSQGLTINGTLTLESGILDVGSNALVFQTGATPIAVTSGSLTVSTATNITFGANAAAFTIPNNTFTTAPTITSLNINRAGGVTIGNQNFTLNGTLTLTAGVFNVLNSTLTFQNGTPIARNGTTQTGTLSISSAGNLVFGTTGNLGGAAFTVPNNVFTTSPVIVNNFTVNRTNALTLGNQSLTIDGGTLTLTAGAFSLGANTLTLQNSNTPLARTSGTLTVATTSNISFGSTGNTGGTAFTIPTGFFTASPISLNNFTVNRTNSLTLSSQGLTINGTLTLESGILDAGSNALVFQTGATPIAVTSGSLTVGTATNITFGANAAAFTIPNNTFTTAPTINSLTINRAGGVTIGNQNFTLNGTLTLTAGIFNVLNSTLTFQTSNSPIVRSTGTLSIGSTGSIVFGTASVAGTTTLPNTFFTSYPVTFGNLTIGRGTGGIINLSNNAIVLTGDLNETSGTFAVNNALGTLTVQGNANISSATLSVTIAAGSIVIQGNLNLTSGTISTSNATATITVQGSVTGTGTQTLTTVGKLIMTGSGKTLSSGVTYDNVEINSAGNISLNGTTTFTGVTTLTAGNLVFGANTVNYITAATQIVKTAGFITLNASTNLVFGLGGTITVPDNSFNGSSTIASLSIKRAESGATAVTMNWGNNPITISGNLDIVSGTANTTFSTNNAAGTITVNGNLNFTSGTATSVLTTVGSVTVKGDIVLVSGAATHNGAGKIIMTGKGSIASIAGINYSNVELNSTNNFALAGSATLSGILTLTNGSLAIGSNTLTLHTSNTPIVRTSGTITVTTSSNIAFGTTGFLAGGAFTIPNNTFTTTAALNNFTVNRTSALTLGNQGLTINGSLILESGVFSVAANTLTFQNGNTPITRTSGTLTISATGSLVFGTAGNTAGTAFTIPNNVFTTSPVTVAGFTVNRTNTLTLGNQPLVLTGTLTLTAGIFDVSNSGITFQTGNTPITRTSGSLTIGNTGNLSFGTTGNTGGTAFTIPNDVFTNSPVTVNNFTINRTNALTFNNQSLTINGILTLTLGTFSFGNTLTFQNGNTPLARTTGTLTLGTSANLVFGTTGNTGGNAFAIPASYFTAAPNIASLTINRTNALTLNNQNISLSGNLTLTAGTLNDGGRTITVNGNITGTGTHIGAGVIVMPTGSTSISGATLTNLQLNNSGGFSLTGSPTIAGTLTLSAGALSVGNNTLTFHTANSPIARTSGTITLSSNSNLVFGTTGNTGGAAFTIPNNTFTSAPSFNHFTINRTNSLTLGNQDFTLAGNLTLTAGTLNDAGRTITVNGNIAGTATHTGTGLIVMPTGATTISGATLGNLQLNNSTGFSLTGSPTITGTLTLSNGALAVGSNTLTFHTANTPISKTSGTITLNSTSGLVFGTTGNTGGSAFTIPNNTFTSNTEFANFNINRTNDLTLNNQNFALTGILTITAGKLVLPTNYLFTLRSTSITNTAMVGPVGATGSILYNTGAAFRVERYIPQQTGSGVRAYRDIAPSINSGTTTIFNTWQEGGTNGLVGGLYYGTHITGKAGTSPGGVDATTGFDITQTGAKTLNTYDISTVNGDGTWNAANSTNQTNDTLSAFKGYRILIRGNRLVNLYQTPTPATMNAPARLRSTGKLVTGDVVFTTSGVTANGATNTGIRLNSFSSSGYTMVGNPYASVVDWHLLHADPSTANISSTYSVFDPNIGTTGGYATYSKSTGISVPGSTAVNRYIQPGQSIFIQNTTTAPSLTFKESHKATNTANLTNTFRTVDIDTSTVNVSRIYINLKKVVGAANVLMDGTAVAFDNSFSNGEGMEDAEKISNGAENICLLNSNKKWSIEGRLQPTINDTIRLNIWQVTTGVNYKLEINTEFFVSNGLQAYLVDNFNNVQTTLNMVGVTTYAYVTTSNVNSYNNRFNIVFKPSNGTLPVSFISLNATQNSTGINVNWSVSENNINHYEIERSGNAQPFVKLTAVNAKGSSINSIQNYNWNDANPLTGNNFYRISSIANDGKITYSNTVLVRVNTKEQSISIYPNPVKGKTVNLVLQNIPQDNFDVKIYNFSGQLVHAGSINHQGGSGTQTISLPLLAAGTYRLVVIGNNYTAKQNLIVE